MDDLIETEADRARSMIAAYEAWAQRIGARSTEEALALPLNQQDRYLFEGEKSQESVNE
jgi:hypothetical protein